MAEENNVIFREVQKFAPWLYWYIVLAMAAAVIIDCFALLEMTSRQTPPQARQIILLITCGIILPIAIAVFFLMLKMETEVRPDTLYVRFFPFHIHFKKFAAVDLAKHYARTYKPLLEYGGWGIRCGWRGGRAYNVSGNQGVQLIFKNGKKLLIGSQKADELADAISSIMQSS